MFEKFFNLKNRKSNAKTCANDTNFSNASNKSEGTHSSEMTVTRVVIKPRRINPPQTKEEYMKEKYLMMYLSYMALKEQCEVPGKADELSLNSEENAPATDDDL